MTAKILEALKTDGPMSTAEILDTIAAPLIAGIRSGHTELVDELRQYDRRLIGIALKMLCADGEIEQDPTEELEAWMRKLMTPQEIIEHNMSTKWRVTRKGWQS